MNPERRLEFSNGVLTLQQIFMQSERFDFFNSSSEVASAICLAELASERQLYHQDGPTTSPFGI